MLLIGRFEVDHGFNENNNSTETGMLRWRLADNMQISASGGALAVEPRPPSRSLRKRLETSLRRGTSPGPSVSANVQLNGRDRADVLIISETA